MRCLKRNETEFEYLPPDGTETDVNDDGEHTGDFQPKHAGPVTYVGNISTPGRHAVQEFYGKDVRYTHTLVMDDPEVDIKETGVIRWNGHLYDITAVRPSLNVFNAALLQQEAPEEEPAGDESEEEEEELQDGEEP